MGVNSRGIFGDRGAVNAGNSGDSQGGIEVGTFRPGGFDLGNELGGRFGIAGIATRFGLISFGIATSGFGFSFAAGRGAAVG